MISKDDASLLQALHEQRQAADPEHDDIDCWCCCWTCKFDESEEEDEAELTAETLARLKESEEAIARGETFTAEELKADLLRLRGIDVSPKE